MATDRPDLVRSSLTIRFIERVARGSVIVWALEVVTRPFRTWAARLESFVRARLGADVADDAQVLSLIEDNSLVKWVTHVFARAAAAVEGSVTGRLLTPFIDDLRRQTPAYVVRLIGWAIVVGAGTYRLLVGFRDPLLTRGNVIAWALLLLAGAVLMAIPGAFAAAWLAKTRRDETS